jgi:hypothetical protein
MLYAHNTGYFVDLSTTRSFQTSFSLFRQEKAHDNIVIAQKSASKILIRYSSAIRSEPPNETMSYPALSKVRK